MSGRTAESLKSRDYTGINSNRGRKWILMIRLDGIIPNSVMSILGAARQAGTRGETGNRVGCIY